MARSDGMKPVNARVFGSICCMLCLFSKETMGEGRQRRRHDAVVRPSKEIAFPMARHCPIFNRRRSLTDCDDILDMPPSIAIRINRLGATHRALRSKMTKQLLLEHPAGLNK